MLQIVGQCLPSFHRQGQDVLPQRFRAPQRHRARPPVDVADHEIGDFTSPQSHVQRTTNDGIAALRPASGGREGVQQPRDLVGLERAR